MGLIKIVSGGIDVTKIELNCSFIVETSKGHITMYGEILNNKVNESATDASFWNVDKYRLLSEEEQSLIKKLVNIELEKLIYPN